MISFYQDSQIKFLNTFLGVFKTFLRFYKNNATLYTEVIFYALPLEVKEFNKLKNWKKFELYDKYKIFQSLGMTISNFLAGLFYFETFAKIFSSEESRRKKLKKHIDANPHYDFGTPDSVNYLIRGDFEDFHRNRDFDMYMKIMEKRLLNIIEDFLKTKGIDTSEFNDRETNILNNGIIMSGGKLEANNVAVGENSKVKNKVKEKK